MAEYIKPTLKIEVGLGVVRIPVFY